MFRGLLRPIRKRRTIMKHITNLVGGGLLLVAGLASLGALSVPQARAGDVEAQCPAGDATLRGTYMSTGGGTIVGVGPVTFIGTVYFDGQGGLTNPYTVSVAGTISRVVGKATYSVNSDCTATWTTADGTQHFDMRVSPDGNRVDYIETDAGTVTSGSATRVND
jgi:hypothetical protein